MVILSPCVNAALALALVKYTLPVVVVPDSMIFPVYNNITPVLPLTDFTFAEIAPSAIVIPLPIVNAALALALLKNTFPEVVFPSS